MAKRTRLDTDEFIIEEHDDELFGEHRFSLDRRERLGDCVRLVNVGWYRTLRGAMNALSMEGGGL